MSARAQAAVVSQRLTRSSSAPQPELSVNLRTVSGTHLFDPAINGRTVGTKPNAAASGSVSSDFSAIVENVPSGTRTTFEAIRYPSYTQYPNGDITTGTATMAATGTTVSARAEFRRMSSRVIRKRIYLSADVATTIRITDGVMGATSNVGMVSWDDNAVLQARSVVGMAVSGGMTGVPQVAFGVGINDGWLNKRRNVVGDLALDGPPNTVGVRAYIGNSSDLPVYPVGTTETYVEVFYWAAQWGASNAFTRRRELAMVLADAAGVPAGDDLMRLSATLPRALKCTTTSGGSTPSLGFTTGSNRVFLRDSFWGCLSIPDHAFSAALLTRFTSNLSSNIVPEWLQDTGESQYRSGGDNNALALIWAYVLSLRAVKDSNSATDNGLTNTQRNNIIGQLVAKDTGGEIIHTQAADGNTFGHYDWYGVPGAFASYASPHTTGYYACALIAAKRLGYAPGNIDTLIAQATAAYAAHYDAALGHLRFLKNTSTGAHLDYGSPLDMLPEWHAVFILGTSLLGTTTAKACVNYFMTNHAVNLDAGGKALRGMMQHGGTTYPPSAEVGGILEGTYVNGGSQIPFDFMLASLGQYHGLTGMREFWENRKRAEVNIEFDLHESITLVNPSPNPSSEPYNGHVTNKSMAWHGVMAAFERATGLVD